MCRIVYFKYFGVQKMVLNNFTQILYLYGIRGFGYYL